jgi:formate dehydrogenase subunit gamma
MSDALPQYTPNFTDPQEPAIAEPGTAHSEPHGAIEGRVLRFLRSERLIHWSIAVPFMTCYATGMTLMLFFNLRDEGMSRMVFSWIHRISGCCLIVFPPVSAVWHWKEYKIHLQNVRHALTWTRDDIKWLALMGIAAFNRKLVLPEQGKFNAAEKVNFMMVMCSYATFTVTGVILLMPGTAFLSWIAHVAMALIATPLMLGHIYMAVLNRDTRVGLSGMLSGYVDSEWARHHYARWYRGNFKETHDRGTERHGRAQE